MIIEISSQLFPQTVLLRGTVQSWHPDLPQRRVRAGATITLAPDQRDKLKFLQAAITGRRNDVPRSYGSIVVARTGAPRRGSRSIDLDAT